jgi:hypothetical protein
MSAKPRKKNKTTRKHCAVMTRRAEVLRLRLGGATLRQIAKIYGVSSALIHDDLKSELNSICAESREELRKVMAERYAVMAQKWTTSAYNHDDRAAKIVLEIYAAERRMFGLDAPEQREVELSGEGGACQPLIIIEKSN